MKKNKNKITIPSGVVVWVDSDEVLVKFQKLFHQHLRTHYKLKLSSNFVSKEWDYSSVLPKSIDIDKAIATLPSNWTETQEVYEGAKDFMDSLRKLGCRIVIITHVNESLAPGRIQNLINHGIYFDEIYFTMNHKKIDFSKKLALRYQNPEGGPASHFFIDDRAKNVLEFALEMPNFKYGVTLDSPYNREERKLYENNIEVDFSSKNQQEMFKKTLTLVKKSIKSKKPK